jgi:hypothetical protein
MDEVVSIAAFHRKHIAPIAREYTRWALANLSIAAGIKDCAHEPLSRFEETRVTRALYLPDLICRLFGSRGPDRWTLTTSEWDDMERRVLAWLPTAMEPWELEGLACLYYFADHKTKPFISFNTTRHGTAEVEE